MPLAGSPLPDDVLALLAAAAPPLGYQLAAARGDVAALVAAPGVDWPVISEPHTTRAGVRCAALPLAVVAGVVVATAPTLAVFFELPIAPGEVWCLVLWGGVGEERAMLVPMRPVTTLAWGSA